MLDRTGRGSQEPRSDLLIDRSTIFMSAAVDAMSNNVQLTPAPEQQKPAAQDAPPKLGPQRPF